MYYPREFIDFVINSVLGWHNLDEEADEKSVEMALRSWINLQHDKRAWVNCWNASRNCMTETCSPFHIIPETRRQEEGKEGEEDHRKPHRQPGLLIGYGIHLAKPRSKRIVHALEACKIVQIIALLHVLLWYFLYLLQMVFSFVFPFNNYWSVFSSVLSRDNWSSWTMWCFNNLNSMYRLSKRIFNPCKVQERRRPIRKTV